MWAKHHAAPVWCRVSSVKMAGSVTTRCKGRWSEADEYQEDTCPPIHERCRACLSAVVNAPSVDFKFDMHDLDEPIGGGS